MNRIKKDGQMTKKHVESVLPSMATVGRRKKEIYKKAVKIVTAFLKDNQKYFFLFNDIRQPLIHLEFDLWDKGGHKYLGVSMTFPIPVMWRGLIEAGDESEKINIRTYRNVSIPLV